MTRGAVSSHTRRFRAGRWRSVTSVAKERLKSPRARLFVALDLPEDVRDGLAAWQRDQVTAEELRPRGPRRST